VEQIMAEKNSTQNLITAVAIIVALVAVVYAFMMKTEKPIVVTEQPVKTIEVTENNPVVLTVNGKDVTRVEILDNFAQSGSQLPQGANLAQIFPLLQEQYLVGKVIEMAAKDKGIDTDHPKVQEALQKAKDRALRAAYMDDVGKEMVTEEDIRKAYEDIIGNQPDVMERKARHILLKDESKANALIVKLNQGRDFAKLASENSEGPTKENGGDLGYFSADQMVPEFSKAAFDLEVGDYTKTPVKTQFGYHIILVEDERQREKPAFDLVKEQLGQQLRQAASAEKIQELRENADVTIYDFEGNVIKAEEPTEEVQPMADEAQVDEEPVDDMEQDDEVELEDEAVMDDEAELEDE